MKKIYIFRRHLGVGTREGRTSSKAFLAGFISGSRSSAVASSCMTAFLSYQRFNFFCSAIATQAQRDTLVHFPFIFRRDGHVVVDEF